MLRRRLLLGLGATALWGGAGAFLSQRLAAGLPTADLAASDELQPLRLEFTAACRPRRLLAAPAELTRTLGYSPDAAIPIVRARLGQPLEATLVNGLNEHTTIHWHGQRIPNAMDGVPYLTQPPVEPGQRFTYRFTPPDAGTTFFHPHCDTVHQLGHGLVGVLVVEGDTDHPFAADLVLACKDWLLADDGSFGELMSLKGAARAGTYGNLRSINGEPIDGERLPVYQVPTGTDVRLRFLNLDNTRVVFLALEGAEGFVIATDGLACDPFALSGWPVGPAMRADLAVRMPNVPGAVIEVRDLRAAKPVPLARLRAVGPPTNLPSFVPPRLAAPLPPAPDLDRAVALPFEFSTAGGSGPDLPADLVMPNGEALRYADALCLSPRTLWAINRTTWPQAGHEALPPPLAILERGRSYVFELFNSSKFAHPIHLHGHSFLVLGSDATPDLPRHWADTTLLEPGERRRVAFVADNPGDWMFHCHVVEHQETGMMAYLRVT